MNCFLRTVMRWNWSKMETISSERLRMALNGLWPNLQMIWPTDPNYEVVPVKKLKEILNKCSVSGLTFMGDVWDCDNFALQLHAKVQKHQYDEVLFGTASKTPWAFGECLGTRFRGDEINHAINISITDNGVYLIEPQTNEIWKADKTSDKPYFIKF